MTLLNWLRRLGILRFGAEEGVYRNATERPAGLQMDDVFDSRQDVLDLERSKQPGAAGKKATSSR